MFLPLRKYSCFYSTRAMRHLRLSSTIISTLSLAFAVDWKRKYQKYQGHLPTAIWKETQQLLDRQKRGRWRTLEEEERIFGGEYLGVICWARKHHRLTTAYLSPASSLGRWRRPAQHFCLMSCSSHFILRQAFALLDAFWLYTHYILTEVSYQT